MNWSVYKIFVKNIMLTENTGTSEIRGIKEAQRKR